MATDTKTDTKTETEKTKTVDYLAQIGGNLHQANARTIFGDKWLPALQATAAAGGYGLIETATFEYEFFGGLQIPVDIENQTAADAARIKGQRAEINRALNELK